MFVLVACEESQVVCKAFRDKGHIAFSCDIQDCSGGHPEWHIKDDVLKYLEPIQRSFIRNGEFVSETGIYFTTCSSESYCVPKWDLIIAHPPCTMLCVTSAVALSKGYHTKEDLQKATDFFMRFYNLEGVRVCIENPRPLSMLGLPMYSQTIQPYEFAICEEDNYTKLTLLWLKGLPPLIRKNYASTGRVRSAAPSWTATVHSAKARSMTFKGIAHAMADQWDY